MVLVDIHFCAVRSITLLCVSLFTAVKGEDGGASTKAKKEYEKAKKKFQQLLKKQETLLRGAINKRGGKLIIKCTFFQWGCTCC